MCAVFAVPCPLQDVFRLIHVRPLEVADVVSLSEQPQHCSDRHYRCHRHGYCCPSHGVPPFARLRTSLFAPPWLTDLALCAPAMRSVNPQLMHLGVPTISS